MKAMTYTPAILAAIESALEQRDDAVEFLAQAARAGRDFNHPQLQDLIADVADCNRRLVDLGYLPESA